jgi:DNA-binding NarL/FixJ family response regulator
MNILIVDDHPVVRRGLKQILADEFTDASFHEAGDEREAMDCVFAEKLDLVLLDITLPGRSGLDILKDIKKEKPNMSVLVISVHSEDEYAIRVLKAGAAGYLTKESAPNELVLAVQKIQQGGRYVNVSVAEKLAAYVDAGGSKEPHENLSDREFEVLCLIASGKTVSEIGAELSLSVKTISTYRARILQKMKMQTNADITKYAIGHGLVE